MILVKRVNSNGLVLKIIWLITFPLLFTSCIYFNKKPITPLDSFLNRWKNKIPDKNLLFKIKNTSRDSLDVFVLTISEEFTKVYQDSSSNARLYDFLNKNKIDPFTEFGVEFLLTAFHSNLNEENIDVEEIKTYVSKTLKRREKENGIKQKKLDLELKNINQINNDKWKVGDTLNIIFPIEYDPETGDKIINYSMFPFSLDYSNAHDTLKIKGLLISKRFESSISEPDIVDSMNLVFNLKIIMLSDTNTYILGDRYKLDDKLDLYLKYYGRLIE